MSEHVETCLESIWYELIWFLNMSILEIKTWQNTLKFEQMAERKFGKVIPWIASSKSSDQKDV